MAGKFIISLDFELHWGVADLWDLESRKQYFLNTRESIPKVLELFKKYEINATWATVGFLFARDKKQLLDFSPVQKPEYLNKKRSNYHVPFGNSEKDDPFHFASSIIEKIIETDGQELASHTYSHYYCNEVGQNIQQFSQDLQSAQAIAKENFGIQLKSLVLPRNQFNSNYLKAMSENGFTTVRTNPEVWFWQKNLKFANIARAIDTLFPISKSLSFCEEDLLTENAIFLQPASRFYRAYHENEKLIQFLKIRRVKSEMKEAAKNNKSYHLWWHPHNFGNSTEKNLEYLEEILKYFKQLQLDFNFTSQSMNEMVSY